MKKSFRGAAFVLKKHMLFPVAASSTGVDRVEYFILVSEGIDSYDSRWCDALQKITINISSNFGAGSEDLL